MLMQIARLIVAALAFVFAGLAPASAQDQSRLTCPQDYSYVAGFCVHAQSGDVVQPTVTTASK